MTRDDLKAKVEARLQKLERNPFDAARKGGLERSFINDILIGKKLSVRGANLSRLGVALDVSPAFFLDDPAEAQAYRAKVVGQIGAGAEISPEFEQVPEEGLFQIEAGIVLPEDAIGFEVVGHSMWPRYDPHDVIICRAAGVPLTDLPPGEEAAVRTVGGQRYLKRVLPAGRKGVFDLESHNGPPIKGVRLEWAADVWTVVRANKWRRLTDQERAKIVRKTARAKR